MIETIEIQKCDKCGEVIDKKNISPNTWFFDLNYSNGILSRLVIPLVIKHIDKLQHTRDTQEGAIFCKNCQKEILKKILERLEE